MMDDCPLPRQGISALIEDESDMALAWNAVKGQVTNILSKLGANDRTQAVTWRLNAGSLNSSSPEMALKSTL